jgi:tetratricopeptide (TPR) repeat protein
VCSSDLDKALIRYKKANELANQKEGWILANIGNIYNNQGFFTEAILYLKKSLEITPDSEYSHDRLAKALKSKAEEDKKEDEILVEAKKKTQF